MMANKTILMDNGLSARLKGSGTLIPKDSTKNLILDASKRHNFRVYSGMGVFLALSLKALGQYLEEAQIMACKGKKRPKK